MIPELSPVTYPDLSQGIKLALYILGIIFGAGVVAFETYLAIIVCQEDCLL